jgi:hypothetical protein
MITELQVDVIPRKIYRSRFDASIARRAVALANQTTRRGFLGWVGRGSAALLGGSYLVLWRTESAYASPCDSNNGPYLESDRFSCLCTEVTGNNSCPNCCSGFWKACPTNQNDPAACIIPCHLQPPLVQFYRVRLFDCCAQCAGQADSSKAGCWSGANNWCAEAGLNGYCNEGGCCSGSCTDWRVKCVVKDCLWAHPCGQIITNCN